MTHGTIAAYRRHKRDGTDVCEACRTAKRDASRAGRKRRGDTGMQRERLSQRARRAALSELRRRHPTEYTVLLDVLLRQQYEAAGLDPATRP